MGEFSQDLESIADKVLGILEQLHPDESLTAWDLKFKLKVSLSDLYMALGILQGRELIRINPEGMTYRIQLLVQNKPSQPVLGVPLEIAIPNGDPVASKS